MPYRFFFSYARETYKASSRLAGGNWLDDFFDSLCARVALLTGDKTEVVGYRDTSALRLSEEWGPKLVEGLQDSAVLVAVFSAHYFDSPACGREFAFFRSRLEQMRGRPGGAQHRIIPVFWTGELFWHGKMQPHVREFMRGIQLTAKGFPESYGSFGLIDFYTEKKRDEDYEPVIGQLARRIWELNDLPALPRLSQKANFADIRSFFDGPDLAAGERVAQGPLGTNVIYAVATREMMGERATAAYAEKAEEWRPFSDNPNCTVGASSRNGLENAGQNLADYCAMPLSGDLMATVEKARASNSIVLLVLDQTSLRCESITKPLADYDGRDTRHVGLVGAGSKDDEELLKKVFPVKYGARRAYHLWTVPPKSAAYEQSVTKVVSGLRAQVQGDSQSAEAVPSSLMPTLTQPAA